MTGSATPLHAPMGRDRAGHLPIVVVCVALNILGDGVRDEMFDPRAKLRGSV